MPSWTWFASLLLVPLSLGACRSGPVPRPTKARPAWVKRSDAHSQVLLNVLARFNPETAAFLGVGGVDEEIVDLKAGFVHRSHQATAEAVARLRGRLARERHPLVRQDLRILIRAAERSLQLSKLGERFLLEYPDLARILFSSMRGLLSAQVSPSRRRAAVVRLLRYAGLEKGYQPIVDLALARLRRRLKVPGLRPPSRADLMRTLTSARPIIAGVGKLCRRFGLEGFEKPYSILRKQLRRYHAALRRELLPRTTNDFRLPRQIYGLRLRSFGIDLAPEELIPIARAAFGQIQRKMEKLAPRVARALGLSATDYRGVIRELKRRQIRGKAILAHYRKRLRQIEAIIRREKILTLPARPARIRLASVAESAALPAPNMRPPRLLGNKGELGTFVLPLRVPGAKAGKTLAIDDFTFEAASWTLTAHEARPGHELQFAAIVEGGVSIARAIFAMNSTNVEGWGLYAESLMFPFLPPQGQLIALQHRLLRAARAFLDPELQLGRLQRKQAFQLLRKDVVLSKAMARQEVERYTFRAPGQAPSYFYGFTKLLALRREVEKALGSRFNARRFHDFILSQGLLPPPLLKRAVQGWLRSQVPGVAARIGPGARSLTDLSDDFSGRQPRRRERREVAVAQRMRRRVGMVMPRNPGPRGRSNQGARGCRVRYRSGRLSKRVG